MKQKIIYQLVNTAGELSAIVLSSVTNNAMPKVATRIMRKNKQIEQVGFMNKNTFRMMGGELSVNGLLAAEYLKTGKKTIQIPRSIVQSMIDNQVTFNGMTYLLLPNPPSTNMITTKQKLLLKKLTTNNPASGIIYYNNSSIKPLIFVYATNSYVWEQSCGSGSIAYALYSGRKRIKQPSGQIVSITVSKNDICYTANVWYDQKKIL